MVQIEVNERLAEILEMKARGLESERAYLLDALCETIKQIYLSRDGQEDTITIEELYPLYHLAKENDMLKSLIKVNK